MKLRHPFLIYGVIAVLVVVLDQVSKAYARAHLVPGQTLKFIPGLLYITLTKNSGAAFGILSGQRPVFIAVTLLVVAVILVYLWRQRPASPLVVIGLGLVSGGAIGNLIDRAGTGRVTDFFDFAFIDFPVFNVADTAIFVGVALLILWLLIAPPHAENEQPAAVPSDTGDSPGQGTGV